MSNLSGSEPGSEPGEDLNVRQVHGQLLREKSEPHESVRRVPAWMVHGFYAPILIWGLWYLFVASGGFRWDEYNEGPKSTIDMAESAAIDTASNDQSPAASPAPAAAATATDLREEGKKVYQSVCFACHQNTGLGLPGAFPPLIDSEWVTGDDRHLALIVLHGLMGPIEVGGETWNGVMPPQGSSLDDLQIAAALTYIRSEWGNDAAEVSPDTVAKMRAEFEGHAPWTTASFAEEGPK